MNFQIIFIFAVIHGLSQAELLDLSCRQIRAFVKGHNSRRLLIAKGELPGQPPASDMKFMVWDELLADKAGWWAAKNKYASNPHMDYNTGENIYWESVEDSPDYKIDIRHILTTWFDKYEHYTYGPFTDGWNNNYPVSTYTQMAWANTKYIGCAISKYGDMNSPRFFVVCNYGPKGNIQGETPYEIGTGNSTLICDHKNCDQPYGIKCHEKKMKVVSGINKIVNGDY